MESNVYTLIGNRMKDSRACWSIHGANHLALLLCLHHTTGFDYLFAKLPEKPVIQREPEWKDTLPMFGASKVPEREGHGYEYPVSFNTSNVGGWFTNLVRGIWSGSGIYHVMLRGANRQTIFLEPEDYEKYLQVLVECKAISGCKIYAYCLMRNHVHLLLQVGDDSIDQIMTNRRAFRLLVQRKVPENRASVSGSVQKRTRGG